MLLTIFTPTYNRAYTLPRLFESLQAQSNKQFEWLICDDGSSDNTDEVVQRFIDAADGFQIKYLKQQHGGKHRAQNIAMNSASGKYFITCDSNKYLSENAVELIITMFDTIKDMPEMCGVGGYRADFCGNVYGGSLKINGQFVDCTNIERQQFNLGGDKATAFYTDVLRHYPFPEFEGEYFVSESAWLTPMAMDGYKIRWFPQILVYGEYTEDGLTKQGANDYRGHFKNFNGFLYVLGLEIQAYGLHEKLPEIYEAFDIAKEKGVQTKILCDKLLFSRKQISLLRLRRIFGKIKRRIEQR